MTEVVKVTSKGQITLPIEIRKAIGLDKDSYLLVEQVGNYVLMKKAEVRMKEIQKIFSKEAKRKGITKKQLLKALRKVQSEKWTE
jgi:AbrB family looped-hinge helix DNA binding protein